MYSICGYIAKWYIIQKPDVGIVSVFGGAAAIHDSDVDWYSASAKQKCNITDYVNS